jgi:hypothetical protein
MYIREKAAQLSLGYIAQPNLSPLINAIDNRNEVEQVQKLFYVGFVHDTLSNRYAGPFMCEATFSNIPKALHRIIIHTYIIFSLLSQACQYVQNCEMSPIDFQP